MPDNLDPDPDTHPRPRRPHRPKRVILMMLAGAALIYAIVFIGMNLAHYRHMEKEGPSATINAR